MVPNLLQTRSSFIKVVTKIKSQSRMLISVNFMNIALLAALSYCFACSQLKVFVALAAPPKLRRMLPQDNLTLSLNFFASLRIFSLKCNTE